MADETTNVWKKHYTYNEWKSADVVTVGKMNNIEQGIDDLYNLILGLDITSATIDVSQTNLISLIEEMSQKVEAADLDNIISAINQQVSTEVGDAMRNFQANLDSAMSSAEAMIQEAASIAAGAANAAQSAISSFVEDVWGEGGVDNGGEDSLKDWVAAQIAALNISTVNSNIAENNRIATNAATALGADYPITTANWSLGNTETVSTRLNTLYDTVFGNGAASSGSLPDKIETAIGRPLSPTAAQILENPNYASSLLELIEELQDTLGVSSSSAGGTSLIEKIEAALGRDLEYSQENPAPDDIAGASLLSTIRSILNTLGMEGGISSGQSNSTLIEDVEMALNLLYGYSIETSSAEDPENPGEYISTSTIVRHDAPNLSNLQEPISISYPSLYNDFYGALTSYTDVETGETKVVGPGVINVVQNLGTDLGKVAAVSNSTTNLINTYQADIERIGNAYSAAERTVIGDKNYLVLKPMQYSDNEPVTDPDDISSDALTYIELPEGGGGAGGGNYYGRMENVTRPASRNISLGDDHIYSFTWQAYSVVAGQEPQIEAVIGNLRVNIGGSIVYTREIESGQSVSINLGSYIHTTGRKTISIIVSADGYPDTPLSGYVMVYEPSLIIDLNTRQVFSSNTISFPYLASIGNNTIAKTLYIELDGVVVSNTNVTYLETSYSNASIPTPVEDGGHLLTVYFKYVINEGDEPLESNKYNFGIITNRSGSYDSFVITDLEPNIELTQYDQLLVNYMVYGSLSNTHNLKISVFLGDTTGSPIATYNLIAENLTPPLNPWVYAFNTIGTFILRLEVDENIDTRVEYTILVNDNTQYSFVLQRPQSLVLNLTPDGRSNQEPALTRSTWENSITSSDAAHSNVEIQMNNFLFSDQNNYDGWLRDDNNKSILRLRNTDEVIINNCPLLRQTNDNNGIDTTVGLTLEIEFKTSDVVNLNTVFFEQFDAGNDVARQQSAITSAWETELDYRTAIDDFISSYSSSEEISEEDLYALAVQAVVGENSRPYENWTVTDYQNELARIATELSIVLTPQSFTGNARAKTELQYKEEELTTISYVFNPQSATDDSLLIYCYINGILSSIKTYNRALDQSPSSFIRIGSSECTTDIYAIRLYNVALSSREVVQNWIYGLSNINDKIRAYTRNNYGDATLTDELFAQHSTTTPYMVIIANGPLEDPNAMPQAKGSKLATTVKLKYVDPVNPENSFESSETSVQVQGTSSQYYPRKNYKLKMKNFTMTESGILHKPKRKDGDPENMSTEGYKLYENSVPVFNFCIKADYASSEGVNNTGLARLYDDIVRSFYKTPPQILDNTNSIRQAVDGRPMVVFYQEGYQENGEWLYKTPYFLGKYNFNNDKGTHEVFGLETFQENWYYPNGEDDKPAISSSEYIGDESWEGADNFYPLNIFMPFSIDGQRGYNKTALNENDWKATFPARFPGVWEDYPEIADHERWYEAICWVYNTRTKVLRQNAQGAWYDAAASTDPRDADYYVGPEGNKTRDEVLADHLAEFKAHFSDYFNLDAMLFFYVFTEFFLMVDNRAKNMFWTRYLTTADRNKTDILAAAQQTYDTYFSLPYDFDTAMGIDNQGMFKFGYNLEGSDETMADGSLIFNGQPSIFWTNFAQAFDEEIGDTFRELLNNSFINPTTSETFRFNYNTVESRFEQHQNAWSETIFNEDAIFKYVKAHANYFMAQGSKREQRQWWLYNRFRYFISKYRAAGISSNDAITIRANSTGTIKISTVADCYITFQLGSDSTAEDSLDTQRVYAIDGETTFSLPQITANNSVVVIYPASAIKSISGLASLSLQTVDFRYASKIQNLAVGDNSIQNGTLDTIFIDNNPLLRHLDIRNCSALTTDLNLSKCSSLESVYLAGTRMNSITLPNGGILKTAQYPLSATNITISNQPYLENVIIDNFIPDDEIALGRAGDSKSQILNNVSYSSIRTLSFTNTAATNDITHIITHSPNLNNCTLNTLTFTMSGTDFKTLFDKLVEVKSINNVENGIIGQVNITNCVLYLTSPLPSTLTINEIGAQFGEGFKIYEIIDGVVKEYYTVTFKDSLNTILDVQYIISGGQAVPTTAENKLKATEYIESYNARVQSGWTDGDPLRYYFKRWNGSYIGITADTTITAVMDVQYLMKYIFQTTQLYSMLERHEYLFENDPIEPNAAISTQSFERDYYNYTRNNWTLESTASDTSPIATHIAISSSQYKQAQTETWYAMYERSNMYYDVFIYNTDVNGNKAGEALNKNNPLRKTVIAAGGDHYITSSDLAAYIPTDSNGIHIYGVSEHLEQYKFLNWQPYIPAFNGLPMVPGLEIKLMYYNTEDVYTNYFLNKLVNCNLGNAITRLPQGAFTHNTNLLKLRGDGVANIGAYSFSGYSYSTSQNNPTRYFVFGGTNPALEEGCFLSINNAIIIFTGTGAITVDNLCFNSARNCTIIILNSDIPLVTRGDRNSCFNDFATADNNNFLYVTDTAYTLYPDSSNATSNYKIPSALINNAKPRINLISNNTALINSYLQEAGLLP